jgi:hypothetical protein
VPHITIEHVILLPMLIAQILVFPLAANMMATTWRDTQREAELQNAADHLASTIQQLYLFINQKEISCAWTFSETIGDASNTTLIDAESFEGGWPPPGWSETGNWARESNYAYDGTYSADFDGGGWSGTSGSLYSTTMVCSDADAIYIDFYWYDNELDDNELILYYYDGSQWDNHQDLNQLASGNGWHHYTEKLADNQYFVSNFGVQWRANDVESGETGCVDLVTVKKEVLEIVSVGNVTQITQTSTVPPTILSYPYTAVGTLATVDSTKVLTLSLTLQGTTTTVTSTALLGSNALWNEESAFSSVSPNASIKVQKFANGTLLFSFGS